MRNVFRIAAAAGALLLAQASSGAPARSELAPDRFRFAPMDFSQIGREVPFVYDIPGAIRDAKRDPRTTYSTWVGLGMQAYRERNYDEAAVCFSSAALKTNEPPDSLRHLHARALLAAGKQRDAEEAWDEILVKKPADAEALWQSACSLFLRDEPDAALARIERLRNLAPAHPFPPLLAGLVRWAQNERAAAGRDFVESTRKSRAPAQSFLALAALASESGGNAEAVGWLRRAFDRLPADEQRTWYFRTLFEPLRKSGSPLIADFEREFNLNGVALPIEAAGPARPGDSYDLALDRIYNSNLEFAPLREAEGTNAPPVPEGLQVLRLAPRLVPR